MPRTASQTSRAVAPPQRVGGEGLFDVAQRLRRERFTGRMVVTRPGVQGHVDFRDGDVVGARYHHHVGRAAFARALRLRSGRVRFIALPGDAGPIAPFDQLLKVARAEDREVEQRAGEVGGLDRVWEMRFSALKGVLDAMPDEINPILRLVDGRRSVRDILETSAHDATLVVRVLARLLRMGLLLMPDAYVETASSPLGDALRTGDKVSSGLGSDTPVDAAWFDSHGPAPAAPMSKPVKSKSPKSKRKKPVAAKATPAPVVALPDVKASVSRTSPQPDATTLVDERDADALISHAVLPEDDDDGDEIIEPHDSVIPQAAREGAAADDDARVDVAADDAEGALRGSAEVPAATDPHAAADRDTSPTSDRHVARSPDERERGAADRAGSPGPKEVPVVPEVPEPVQPEAGDHRTIPYDDAEEPKPAAAAIDDAPTENDKATPAMGTMGPRLFDAASANLPASRSVDAPRPSGADDDDRTGPPAFASTIRPLPAEDGPDAEDAAPAGGPLADVHVSQWSVGSEGPYEDDDTGFADAADARAPVVEDATHDIVSQTPTPPEVVHGASDQMDPPIAEDPVDAPEKVERSEEALDSWLKQDDVFFERSTQSLVKEPETSALAVGALALLTIAVVAVVAYFAWVLTQPKLEFTDAQADAKLENAAMLIEGGSPDEGCDELSEVKKGVRIDAPQYRKAWDAYEASCR